jgi:hypothetical protein
VDLGSQPRLADREPAGQRRRRHPYVDAELADVIGPVVEREIVPHEIAAHSEVATDRLADPMAVQRPRERVRDGVGDRAVVLVAGIQRGDEVVAALEDRPRQELDPFGHDRAQVGVDDHQGLDVERGGDLEDRSQRCPLAADAVDLGVGQADALEPVVGARQQDLLDVVRRFGLDHDAAGTVRRSGVRVDHHGAEVREVLDEPGLSGTHDITDRRGVLEARDTDHDVGAAQTCDLIPDGRREDGLGHRLDRTT